MLAVFRYCPLLAVLAIPGLVVHASAQVNYVRELGVPSYPLRVLNTTQAPYEIANPSYSFQPPPFLFTKDGYYPIDSATGTLPAFATAWPVGHVASPESIVTYAGQNTANPVVAFTTAALRLTTVDMTSRVALAAPSLSGGPEFLFSMAARGRDHDLVSFIGDGQHYTVSKSGGQMTAMPLDDVDMDDAFYQSYGQDGLLYVLDYSNERIASFDPDNAFEPVGSFSLNTGVTTANVQFAIGITGSFYLADGLGGGSYYDSTGAFQGAFSLPVATVGNPYEGASYVSTDSAGRVYVFDRATGFHQYADAAVSAVPEPGTTLAGVALLCLAGASRRRRVS